MGELQFPKLKWHHRLHGWLVSLLPRCRAKSAGLQCQRRWPHLGPHSADWRLWDRKGVYRDRLGRLLNEASQETELERAAKALCDSKQPCGSMTEYCGNCPVSELQALNSRPTVEQDENAVTVDDLERWANDAEFYGHFDLANELRERAALAAPTHPTD